MSMYLIPTIDVEAIDNLKTQGSFDQLILGKTNQGQWGVPKIMGVLKDNRASASFFIDFAEFPKYSKKFKVLTNDLSNNNFDVQLHIHPQFCADINRPLMQHYTFEEQVKIIKQCQLYYHECCKTPAIAFRAGGYGANQNTLAALVQNNIQIDSSFFPEHKWCDLSDLPINTPSKSNNVIEIPITVFHNRIKYKIANKPVLIKLRQHRKFDIDFYHINTLSKALSELKGCSIQIVILFLHSYSLLKRNLRRTQTSPDINKLNRLDKILKIAKQLGYEIISLKDLVRKTSIITSDLSFPVPTIDTEKSLVKATKNHISGLLSQYFRGIDYLPHSNRLKR